MISGGLQKLTRWPQSINCIRLILLQALKTYTTRTIPNNFTRHGTVDLRLLSAAFGTHAVLTTW